MSCFKETREAIFFFFLSLSFGFGIQFCVVFLFLSFKRRTTRAQRECARAVEESFWARCFCCSPIYIYLYSKREKERGERNWMSMMCVWVRERPPLAVGKKNERNVPPFTKHTTKKEEIIVSFSRGEMRLFRVIFFLFFQTSLSLLCIVC